MQGGTSADGSRFLRLPSTALGRVSSLLLIVAVLLSTLMATVFESALPSVGQLNLGPLVGVLFLLAAMITGGVALIRDRERSWAVWTATALPAIVLGAEVISLLIPGE